MNFSNTATLAPFVKEYYTKNIKQYLKVYKKETVYFPKDCSGQMANLVTDLVISYGYDSKLGKAGNGVYVLNTKHTIPKVKEKPEDIK